MEKQTKKAWNMKSSAVDKTAGFPQQEHDMFKSALIKLLKEFDEISRKHNVKYWLDCGTLLGFYRDGDFIKNDKDIDVSVDITTIHPKWVIELYQKGLLRDKERKEELPLSTEARYLKRAMTNNFDWALRIAKVERKNSQKFFGGKLHPFIDIFFRINEGGFSRTNAFGILTSNSEDTVKELTTIDTKYGSFYIPINTEKYLTELFGDNWKTPNPDWEDKPGAAPALLSAVKYGIATYNFKTKEAKVLPYKEAKPKMVR